jgi:hypothetical protein
MKDDKKTTTKETDFQGLVSLDAIFAATQSKKEDNSPAIIADPVIKTEKPIVEPIKEIEAVEPEPKKIIPPAIVDTTETEAFKTAKRLINLGLLEDFSIQVSEEDENGTAISEFTSMTDENLQEIIKIHKKESEDNISSNFIPKKGLREHELKVIEILQKGGDWSKLGKTEKEAFQRPFEGFDMTDKERQMDVLYTDLVHQKGLSSEDAMIIINADVKSETLATKANTIFDSYRTAHTTYVDKMLVEQNKAKEHKELNFKENRKELTAKLKEAGLKESVYKKVSAEYAKKNDKGEHVLVEKLREALKNPGENHELILHLADKQLFNDTFKIKAAQESHRAMVKLASGSGPKGNRQVTKTQQENNTAPWLKIAENHNASIKKN